MIRRLLNLVAAASLALSALVFAAWAVSHRRHVAVQWRWRETRVAFEIDRGDWVWFTNDGPTVPHLPRFSTWRDWGRLPEWKSEVYGRTEQTGSGEAPFGAEGAAGHWGDFRADGATRHAYTWWTAPMWPSFVALTFLAAGAGVGTARAAVGSRVARRRSQRGLCTACGYDVRASPGRCPECGVRIASHATAC